MKMKKFVALVSAVSMLGSAFTALPLTAGAEGSETVFYEQDFEELGAQTLLEHKLDTEEAVNAVKDGYTDMVVSGEPAVLTWTDAGGGSMNMNDVQGRYNSAGIRYDITELVAGKSGKLTITADVRGGYGEVFEDAGRVGFMNETQAAAADSSGSSNGFMYNFPAATVGTQNSGDFTTISYTANSIPEYDTNLYFFIGITKPDMNVKNVRLTLEDESAGDSRITPFSRFYSMTSSITSDTRDGMMGNYLALKHSNEGTDPGQGVVIDLSGSGIENGEKLDISFDIATDSENLGHLQTFVVSDTSVESLTGTEGFLRTVTASGGENGWVAQSNGGYENTFYSSANYHVSYTVDQVTLDEGENPYLCIMNNNPTIYIDNIMVSPAAAEPDPDETPESASPVPTASAPVGTPAAGDFVIADVNGVTDIYIDSAGADYDGISLVAEAFANDVTLVSGQTPDIVTDAAQLGSTAIIAGTTADANIQALVSSSKIDVSDIEGKNEVYKIQYVEEPMDGVDKAVVIAGSDKRGTIYGIFHISELIGVSPWVYWGDALPEQKSGIALSADELNTTSKEPSVRFRGIFLNDEYPNLTKWSKNTFGGYNHNFYQQVFELILRLKGNYLWPAMWSNVFNKEGIAGLSAEQAEGFDSLESARLADKYGVLMGTSHHEPMHRAGMEWGQEYKNYLTAEDAALGSGATWDYFNYAYALDKFWDDGFKRSKDFETVTTIGMRGEADSSLAGGLATNVENLENVISSQLEIIEKYGKSDAPTMLALYKEVEEYWYGGEENGEHVPGLKEWSVNGKNPLDDTIIMLCDDNFGNLRSVPQPDEIDRPGGWGLYYHFDYHGAPTDYRWVSSTPLEKIWENLTRAYEYKMDDLWIVNVGDLKPHELEISYFLDLAYDYDAWKDENKIEEYTREWTEQQFGYEGVSEETVNEIAELQLDYLKLNGTRRPEIVYNTTYSVTDANEVYNYIDKANSIYDRAYELLERIPERIKDSYYQIVLYQAAGSANVNLMSLYSALNGMYSSAGSVLANKYAVLVNECIERDTQMQDYYNNTMSGGKWKDMMSDELAHIGCTSWDLTKWAYPSAVYVSPSADASLIVNVDGTRTAAKAGGTVSLPTFTSTNKEAYAITVSNGGKNKFNYTAQANVDWIVLSKASGTIYSGDTIGVSIDWSKLTEDSTGTVTISGADGSVTVNVTADVIDVSGLDSMTFVGRDGMTAIEAEHYASSNGNWITIDNYGKTLSTIKTKPFNVDYNVDNAPYVEYKVMADEAGDYTLKVYATPSNPTTTSGDVRYAVGINGGKAVEYSSLEDGFLAGDHGTRWGNGVLVNIHEDTVTVSLNAGVNTIRIYQLSSGFSLQKLALAAPGVSFGNAYTGPEESWYVGADDAQKALVHFSPEDTMNIPGVIEDSGKKVIVTAESDYLITAPEGTVISLDGVPIDTIANPDGTMETTLSQGEYTITYTGEGPVEFEALDSTPGVIINHPMSTEAEFAAAAAGYVNRVDGNDDKRVVSFADDSMNYTTSGLYTSSGFKYDITARVRKAIEEYGAGTEFTLSMDIKGKIGGNGTPAIGFMAGGATVASTPITGVVNESGFTKVTCKTTFSSTDDLAFFVYTGEPTVYVKNISVTFPAPQEVELFDHKSDDDWDNYVVYDETNENAVLTNNGSSLSAEFHTADGWSADNGIKIDVTDYVKKCDNGGKFGVELTFTCWYWGGSVSAFLEDQNGENKVILAEQATDTSNPPEDNTITISGSAAYSYSENERTYLCITQMSDNHQYKEIKFTGMQTPGGGDDPTETVPPTETEDPTEKNMIFTHGDAADWAAYTIYDETNTAASRTEGEQLQIAYSGSDTPDDEKAHEWDTNNGIKIDITDAVTGSGASKLGASADVLSWWWGETAAKLFIEVVSGTDTKIITLDETAGSENGTALTLSGEGSVSYADGDKIYLCVTHPSGTQQYDNILLWSYEGGGDPDATPGPTEPVPEPTPDTRIVVFSDDFSDESEADRYAPYEDGSLDETADNGIKWGRLAYNFSNGSYADNGMKADITDIVKNNGITTLNASIDVLSYWWGGNQAVFRAVVTDAGGNVKNTYPLGTAPEDLTDKDGTYVSVSGSAEIEYEETDIIYLVVTHHSGTHAYDNLVIWMDGSELPVNDSLKIASPVLNEDGNGGYITASNGAETASAITVYVARYNDDGTLAALSLTPAEIQAGAENVRIDFEAAEGDTVFVWDRAMRPLTDKTVLEASVWVAGWGSAQQQYMESDMPSTPLDGSVIRQVIRMSTGGDYMKLTFSNYYGKSDLVLDSVHIADSLGSGMIDLATDTAVTFGGSESVTIPAGQTVESDVICYSVPDLGSIAMTIKAAEVPDEVTGHSGARTTTYIKSGATVSDASMIGAETNEHWYFASEIDVLKDAEYAVVACLGDSITDGRGCTTNANDRWTDVLMERMKDAGMKLTVVNDGIGGNAINNWGLGESGRDRYENEVKNRTGIKYLIVLEGINDIGGRTEDVFEGDMSKCPEDGKITTGIIEAYQEIIDKAHEQGIKVIGGTILPCGNNDYYNETMEEMRQTINAWIREEGNFDAVIDFDAVMSDPDDPTKMKAEYDSGDGLHPGPAGYRAMGECIDLALFD